MRKKPMGIEVFDNILEGGYPENTVTLVCGPPGSGKTLFGLQYIYNGADKYNEPGIYMTMEESRDNLRKAIKNFDMSNWERYEKENKIFLVDMSEVVRKYMKDMVDMDFGLTGYKTIRDFFEHFLPVSAPKRIVIDSLSSANLYYHSVEKLRLELLVLIKFLRSINVTSILIMESEDQAGLESQYKIAPFLCDGFIALGLEKENGEFDRKVTVLKMRYTRHSMGVHPFVITSKGFEIGTG